VPNSPRYDHSVFVLCDGDSVGSAPVGTCFAISARHLLTCYHNLTNEKTYNIAEVVEKTNGVLSFSIGKHSVTVVRQNKKADWAILKVDDDSLILAPIPISEEKIGMDVDLKVFHCPVGIFNDCNTEQVSVGTRWTKSFTPTCHHVKVDFELFKGSSGAPFVLRNGCVVAFHQESYSEANETVELSDSTSDNVEMFSDTINSNVHSHGSLSSGILIMSHPTLVTALTSLNII
jgi:hypothetical protein